MALLYMPQPMLLRDLDVWVKPDAKKNRDQALSILRSLHIVQITPPSKDKPQEMSLQTNFKKSLRLALEGGGDHKSFGVPSALPVDPAIDIDFLDRHARRKWEAILHFVVNSVGLSSAAADAGAGPKASVKDLLLAGRLVEYKTVTSEEAEEAKRSGGFKKAGQSALHITQAGFTFLLQEANAQVWTLLLLWLEAAKAADAPGMDSVDMLSFLFMLASLELGRAYDTDALTEPRRNMLPSLVDFGLIYIPRDNPRQYFPTRLATTLTSTAAALRSVSSGFAAATAGPGSSSADVTGLASHSDDKGSIIVETNYRIYAYTSSPLQIAVLALFCRLNMRFAGMVTGRLTRESIRRAIDYGITADQVIHYLTTHAHEQMKRAAAAANRPILPPTVVDQIRLWQLENERMKATPGFLFRDFETQEEYRDLVTYAEETGVLVWKNDGKRLFFVSKYEQLREYLKMVKKK